MMALPSKQRVETVSVLDSIAVHPKLGFLIMAVTNSLKSMTLTNSNQENEVDNTYGMSLKMGVC